VLYPDLSETGEYRALFDAAISVAINRTMDLTAGLNFRYNSDPGSGLKKSDTLFLTGLTVKFY
jgi:putative salt-induced outer membrane protein YdiY